MIPLFVLTGIATIVLLVVYVQLKSRRMQGKEKDRIMRLWKALDAVQDPAMKVVQADSVLAEALKAAGYLGSMGEMLQQAGPRLPNSNSVWSAHKLRNRIAHEPGVRISHDQAKNALRAFWKALQKLL